MILGVSHIGITVSKLISSISYYQKTFGFMILSDAERKGEWIDKITGIPGFHTRTVYLSVTPYQHLELFEFYHPKPLPAENEARPRIGLSHCAIMKGYLGSLSGLEKTRKEQGWSCLVGDIEEKPYKRCQVITLQDPDGLNLRVAEFRGNNTDSQDSLRNSLLYPALFVKSIEPSLSFYQNVLGLEIANQGGPIPRKRTFWQDDTRMLVRWVILKSPTGPCLKLIQPLNTKVLPVRPWRMERVGFTHVAFAVKNLNRYYAELKERKINFKSSPQSSAAGPHKGGKAVYLSSPEGITLEFIDSPLTREQVRSASFGMTS